MKNLFLSLIAFVTISVQAQKNDVINDIDAEKRTLTSSFTGITITDGIVLYLTQSDEEAIAVSASEQKYLEHFKTEVEGGILKIYFDTKSIKWPLNEKRKLKAYVSFKTLEKLFASAGANVKMQNDLNAADLNMKFTSGSAFNGTINATTLSVDQNSGSTINISGKAKNFAVEVSSGAVFKGFDLVVDICEAKASSGGGIKVTINKELSAKANSGGGVTYKGEAVIKEINVNSGGSVKKA